MNIQVNSKLHICFHEAGHIEAACLWGATVREVEIEASGNPRTLITHKADLSTKVPIACGGYAVEWLLFNASRLVDDQGKLLSEQAFKSQAMENARLDKLPFYIKEPIDESGIYPGSLFQPYDDKTWPEESDEPFIDYAEQHIIPILQNHLTNIESLAAQLYKYGKLTQNEIETIRSV